MTDGQGLTTAPAVLVFRLRPCWELVCPRGGGLTLAAIAHQLSLGHPGTAPVSVGSCLAVALGSRLAGEPAPRLLPPEHLTGGES